MSSIEEIKNRIKNQTGLVMSRVPEPTRSEFIEFANGEFAGDYGLLLRELWSCYKHYQQIINTQDTKLDYLITMVKNINISQPKPEGKMLPKMLGRKLTEREVDEQNEQT
jgi:hypothetical protein